MKIGYYDSIDYIDDSFSRHVQREVEIAFDDETGECQIKMIVTAPDPDTGELESEITILKGRLSDK